MKEALIAAAEALSQAALCLKQAAEQQQSLPELDENSLNAISSLVLKQRDNDIEELKEKVEDLDGIREKVDSIEYEVSNVDEKYQHLEHISSDDVDGMDSRVSELETRVDDVENDKVDDDVFDGAIDEIKNRVEGAVEMTEILAKHFSPPKPKADSADSAGPNGSAQTVV